MVFGGRNDSPRTTWAYRRGVATVENCGEDPMTEEWRPVVGYAGLYEVSSLGRVKSLPRLTHLGRPVRGITKPIIMAGSCSRGYRHVNLAKNGSKKPRSIHKLVMEAFVGLPPTGKQVNHKDFDRGNNQLDNLEYVTKTEDAQHKKQAGRGSCGERNPAAKLRLQDVLAIRKMQGLTSGPSLAALYGVTHRIIYLIWRGVIWNSAF